MSRRPKTFDLTFLLEQAQRRVSRNFDLALRELGASPEQWRVLDRLSDEEGRPIGELAAELCMNPPTMTKLIDRMVAANLVMRIADESDSRRVLVFITDIGIELWAKLTRRADSFNEQLAGTLSAKQIQHLGEMLGYLADRPS